MSWEQPGFVNTTTLLLFQVLGAPLHLLGGLLRGLLSDHSCSKISPECGLPKLLNRSM
jgi:hypothetical protein